MLAPHWTLRWLAMLVLFAICTFGFSAYAGATPGTSGNSADGEAQQERPTDDDRDAELAEADDDPETDGAAETEDDPQTTEREPPTERTPDYMLTITRSAFLGSLLGGLIGGSYYILTGRQHSPWVIGYSAAGGTFFGALVGLVEVAARDSRARHRMQTFDDDLNDQRQRRVTSEPTLPLLHFDF